MTGKEICEKIIEDGNCLHTPGCESCPLNGGKWDCGDNRYEMVKAAKAWLEDHQPCIWQQDEDGFWHTDCGQVHEFMNGSPAENSYVFCPYCGKEIKEVR